MRELWTGRLKTKANTERYTHDAQDDSDDSRIIAKIVFIAAPQASEHEHMVAYIVVQGILINIINIISLLIFWNCPLFEPRYST